MSLIVKTVAGGSISLVSGAAVGAPFSLASNKNLTESSEGKESREGGDIQSKSPTKETVCKPVKNRVVNSLVFLMNLKVEEKLFDEEILPVGQVCLNAIVKAEKDIKDNKEAYLPEISGATGVSSLVEMIVQKFEEGKELGTGGGQEGGSSGNSTNTNKSFVLTGRENGEFMFGKKELESSLQNSNGKVLVAKKETNLGDDIVTVKIGGKDGSLNVFSPQIQIEKKDLRNGKARVEFRKHNTYT